LSRPPHVRALGLEDLPGCESLSRSLGWPWEAPKWHLLVSKGEGFAAEAPDGSLIGTVVLNRFADRAASIGLLGVAPAWGRQGLGRALMERALERAGRVPVFLYSTAKGRGLYARLGFQVAGETCRFIGQLTQRPVSPQLGGRRLRRMEVADLTPVAALDAIAFGAPRTAYLEALFGMADKARVVEEGERLLGYGLGWSIGSRRTVGPIVAPDTALSIALAADLVDGHGGSLRIDIPSEFPQVGAWATAVGLKQDVPAPLMVLHADRAPGRREWLHALAMPGLG
jgi:ribosomal protein S18 acetylase RimI-like enzyme